MVGSGPKSGDRRPSGVAAVEQVVDIGTAAFDDFAVTAHVYRCLAGAQRRCRRARLQVQDGVPAAAGETYLSSAAVDSSPSQVGCNGVGASSGVYDIRAVAGNASAAGNV